MTLEREERDRKSELKEKDQEGRRERVDIRNRGRERVNQRRKTRRKGEKE